MCVHPTVCILRRNRHVVRSAIASFHRCGIKLVGQLFGARIHAQMRVLLDCFVQFEGWSAPSYIHGILKFPNVREMLATWRRRMVVDIRKSVPLARSTRDSTHDDLQEARELDGCLLALCGCEQKTPHDGPPFIGRDCRPVHTIGAAHILIKCLFRNRSCIFARDSILLDGRVVVPCFDLDSLERCVRRTCRRV